LPPTLTASLEKVDKGSRAATEVAYVIGAWHG